MSDLDKLLTIFKFREDDIEPEFIKYHTIYPTIHGPYINEESLVYFRYNPDATNNRYIQILQEEVVLATFYSQEGNYGRHKFKFSNGLNILFNQDNLEQTMENFRFFNSSKNIGSGFGYNHNCKLTVNIYINRNFLLNVYTVEKQLPLFVRQLICDKKRSINIPQIIPIKAIYDPQTWDNPDFLREPYVYQQKNIEFMLDLESKIDSNFSLDIRLLNRDTSTYHYVEQIDDTIIFNKKTGKIESLDDMSIEKFYPRGGCLADEVGLGKTMSMLSLVYMTLKKHPVGYSNTTLILTPSRLIKQWEGEIKITCELRCKLVSSITQYKSLIKKGIENFDVVIMSYSFMKNDSYDRYISTIDKKDDEYMNKFAYQRIKWKRVILDEGHEVLSNDIKNKRLSLSNFRRMKQNINLLQSKYRWICSGTPYTRNLCGILNYLFKNDMIKSHRFCSYREKDFLKLLFRRNTHESVKHIVNIPEPVIDIELLEMSEIERIIYDSALDNIQKRIQLCNHILVSDHHEHILGGNKPITLVEIHNKMTEYYRTKVERLDRRIENYYNKIANLSIDGVILEENEIIIMNLKEEIKNSNMELDTYNTKLSIFESLPDRVDGIDTCPICFEDFDKLRMAVTPCSHLFCITCMNNIIKRTGKCAMCRSTIVVKDCHVVKKEDDDGDKKEETNINKWGTKTARLVEYLGEVLENPDNRVIVFSQFQNMLKLLSKVFYDQSINHLMLQGNASVVNSRIRKFKLDPSIRVVLLCSENSASGLNLTEATHMVLMDTLDCNNPKTAHMIEEQAIGRSVRIGQKVQVKIKRFVMAETIEEDFLDRYTKIYG